MNSPKKRTSWRCRMSCLTLNLLSSSDACLCFQLYTVGRLKTFSVSFLFPIITMVASNERKGEESIVRKRTADFIHRMYLHLFTRFPLAKKLLTQSEGEWRNLSDFFVQQGYTRPLNDPLHHHFNMVMAVWFELGNVIGLTHQWQAQRIFCENPRCKDPLGSVGTRLLCGRCCRRTYCSKRCQIM